MHFAVRLKLAFSITLHLARCFDVFSKGQVDVCMCLSEHVCSAGMRACVHACVGVPALCLHVCRYLFDVCPALRGWKVKCLISPRTQLAW